MCAIRFLCYVDPTSGGVLLQILLGGATGIFVIGKLYWKRMRHFFSQNKSEPPDTPPSLPAPTEGKDR